MLGEKVVRASISPCLYILSYTHTNAVLPATSAAELNGVRLAGIVFDGRNITLPCLLIVLLVYGFMHFLFCFFEFLAKCLIHLFRSLGFFFIFLLFLFEKTVICTIDEM